mmetsp:Transcript_39570/g.29223  ORF Transcript_39570/g.29223 Transcript_39570/m.29223 type:complete len:194 (-) Transcript_39570:447-1028(-)
MERERARPRMGEGVYADRTGQGTSSFAGRMRPVQYNTPISQKLNNTEASYLMSEEEEKVEPNANLLEELKTNVAQSIHFRSPFNLQTFSASSPYLNRSPPPLEEELRPLSSNRIEVISRFVPPPTANLLSPPPYNSPPEMVANEEFSIYNSAPTFNQTAASVRTVGSTAIAIDDINISSSDGRSANMFQGENE